MTMLVITRGYLGKLQYFTFTRIVGPHMDHDFPKINHDFQGFGRDEIFPRFFFPPYHQTP